ncbi:MAG: nuclear transport factor 2 family protein [Thermonemataceae bacterium]
MSTINKEIIAAFNQLVENFEYDKAFDRFYHNTFVKHENENAPIVGLTPNRKAMQGFLAAISNQRATLLNLVISDDMSVAEWRYQFDHKDWGKKDFRQLSVQRWREGKIIHERHHYKTENW